MLNGIFHINVTVRDLDRSIKFYEDLGFEAVNVLTQEGTDIAADLGMRVNKMRVAFMRLRDDPDYPVVDLLQFIDPPSQGEAYAALNNVGVGRIAFTVNDIDKAYEELNAKNVEFLSAIVRKDLGDSKIGVVCFKDPDGTVLELIQWY